MATVCYVCGHSLQSAIYESPDNSSITTMNKIISGKTEVYFCDSCTHLQTSELPNLVEFYAQEYEINFSSDEDDQLYKAVDGKPIYRADHQASVLLSKIKFPKGSRVLDYGCAKAPTLRKVLDSHPDVEPFLFDVTDKYVPFWKKFNKTPKWSTHTPDRSWNGSMDVVLSFYALEHVANLHLAINNIKSLLKEGGTFYFIVPNVYDNIADFIVADHINHFSKYSLEVFLKREGFSDIQVDDQSHESAFVVSAKKIFDSIGSENVVSQIPESEKSRCKQAAMEMASYWQNIVERIRKFENSLEAGKKVAVYGAGFYGNFISSSLSQADRVACFVDQNKHLQGTKINGKPIEAPERLPTDVSDVLVGMNPKSARHNIAQISSWQNRNHNYFYL